MLSPSNAQRPPAPRRTGCLLIWLALFIPWCACALPLVGQTTGELFGLPLPAWLWPLVISLGLLSLLGLLARGATTPSQRAVNQTWRLAALLPLFMIPVALFPPAEAQVALVVQIIMTCLYGGLVLFLTRRQPHPPTTNHPLPLALALPLSLALAIPWLAWGALGSPLDIALGLVGGLTFGWVTATLLSRVWLPVALADPTRTWQTVVGDGFVVGITLLILASAYGIHGASNVLMLTLFPLGWLVMALTDLTPPNHAPPTTLLTLLIGLTTAWPLLFSDTDTLSILFLVAGRETITWALQAAAVTGVLALVLAGAVSVLVRPGAPLATARGALWTALGVAGLGLVLYLAQPQRGLYGDRVFVILKDQADVAQAPTIQDYTARRRWVYRTLVEHADHTQSHLRQLLDRAGVRYTPYYLVNALEVEAGTPLRLLLSQHPAVDRVLPSPVLRPLPEPLPSNVGEEPAPTAPPWNLVRIGAPRVWQELGVRGQGIVIGESDSGVDWQHPQLRDGYRGNQAGSTSHDYNWFDPWDADPEPTDADGHGTHTLGIVMGQTVGVAPAATWIGCKNLGRNVGNPALYLDCMQFMLAPFPRAGNPFTDGDPSRAAHVLNNSWGCPQATEGCDPTSLQPAVRALRAAGIFVVASAGNEGPACSTVQDPIAIYAEVFSVGAIDSRGAVTSFSSVGPVTVDGSGRVKPDIVAPGAGIVSAYPGGSYFRGDGTSQAGPHVTGAVALLWSANPRLIGDIDRTENILRRSAAPYTPPPPTRQLPLLSNLACSARVDLTSLPNNIVGYGVLDVYRAVQLAQEE